MKPSAFLPAALAAIAFSLALPSRAEFQLPDRIAFDGREWEIAVFPLEQFPPVASGQVSLWWSPNSTFPANRRGHVASWEIADDRLWLTGIEGCIGPFMGDFIPASLESLFPDRRGQSRILADWFSGTVFFPSHAYADHLLPLSPARREAQSQWMITVTAGVVSAVSAGTPRPLPPANARNLPDVEYYSSFATCELLARPEVRAELGLSPEQLAAIDAAEAAARAQPPNWDSDSRAIPSPEIVALLSPAQNQRLAELLLQAHGPSVFVSYSVAPELSAFKTANPDAAQKAESAFHQVRSRFIDLANGFRFCPESNSPSFHILADAVEDVSALCDAAALDAMPPEWRLDCLRRFGAPLPVAWPRTPEPRRSPHAADPRAAAEAARGSTCAPSPLPDGFESLGPDAFRLSRENLVFRRISPRNFGIPDRDFFMMETEVPNRAYALFLEDTRRQKGDHELLKEIQRHDSDADRVWTTLDVPYDVDNPLLLWNGNVPPPDRENFPVALVTHVDAMDFCRWLNDRFPGPGVFWLPTREQWCAAAYGGNSRAFPWGDEWDPSIPRVSSSRNDLLAEPVPVDSPTRDVTPQGIRHLGGNVQEYLAAMNPGESFHAMDTSWAGSSFKSTPEDGCPPTTPRRNYWGFHHGAASRQENMGFRLVYIPAPRLEP